MRTFRLMAGRRTGASGRHGEPAESPLKATCSMLADTFKKTPARDDTEASALITAAVRSGMAVPKVADLCARWHLGHQEPDRAVTCIDRYLLTRSSSGRLLLNVAHCLSGCRSSAHLDLAAWSADDSCPVQARRLLALMEADEGRRDAALAAFRRNIDQIDDACSIKGLLLMSAEAGMTELANQWAERLAQTPCAWISHPHLESILEQFGYRHRPAEYGPPPAILVERLSVELLGDESLIPSLIAAAEAEPDASTCRLLESAIQRALPNLEDHVTALESLARLAMLSGNERQAYSWIVKGLDADPKSVPLAMLLADLLPADATGPTEADPTVQPNDDPVTGRGEVIPSVGHIRTDHPAETVARAAVQVEEKTQITDPVAIVALDASSADVSGEVEPDMTIDPVAVISTVAQAHPDWPDVQRVAKLLKVA
ncbi:MAG: hypothetical protein D8M59_14835 [Planctomycetes bacterium]|nr:hypothetical protein [Planctomycetota bacterium]